MTATQSTSFAKAEMLIRKPVTEVFQAFIDPAITTKFWFTKSSGKLEAGKQVQWTWEMYNFTETITVISVKPNEKIEIEWGAGEEQSSVEWTFKQINDNSTFVSVTNDGLKGDAEQVLNAVRNSTEGFTLVLAGLKAYLEHNIQLNLVADRFPQGLGN